ncbi:PA-phosphatase-like phosphoesterase [Streptomyces eurocidicus]|uniref:PA-phosphatase-like phosphoesterase n=1 Tax=Streptomyces eurocidicus TaxID=66423 RepID=A0A2N8NX71_STREU|nr:phosphatase PAP2 family protein [Streptomyces eurocidicus]MBB5120379.1 undecaprenyl-diphosphatase [Streptomyces eurocidicus]MBF6054058.1 phosphatase PAP2 family protein [Streptomyces eurocidicus]PNE33356.1 PA-phosphatase-like phosphoesterase [Streptomyces eurocidicus]
MDNDLYLDITDFARSTPGWFQDLAEVGTEAGLLLLMAVSVAVWWWARRGRARQVALALLVPVTTALAYGISEIVKSVVEEDRPCRAVAGAVTSLAPCPAPGDWSFPSNHATLAAALAAGVTLALRLVAWLVLPLALLIAFSRVFLGVHYPHDAAVGLLLGTAVALLGARLLVGRGTALVERAREGRLRVLVQA